MAFRQFSRKKPDFKNALVQSLMGGNTILFNQTTMNLLKLLPKTQVIITHDWATYLLVSAVDGFIFYDPVPAVRNRQHGYNIIGSNNFMTDRAVRLVWLLRGRFPDYTESNLSLLNCVRTIIPEGHRKTLSKFQMARQSNLLRRIQLFLRLKTYRQTGLGTLGLWLAIILNKI